MPECFNKTIHRLRSLKVYPRVYYFKKRLNDLLPRFHRVRDVFPEPFQDSKWLANIKEEDDKFSNPPDIIVIGTSDLEESRIIVADNGDEDKIISNGERFEVFVCYIKLEHSDLNEGIQIIQKHLENLYNELQNEDDPFERLVVMCDILNFGETDNQRIREYIHERIRQHYPSWSKDNRIIIGPDNVTLNSTISEMLEDHLISTFELVFGYLGRFMRSDSSTHNSTETDLKETVVISLQSITRNFAALHDIKTFHDLLLLKPSSEKPKSFVDSVVTNLVKCVRCALVKPFTDIYQIPINICCLILDEFDFDTELRKSISNTTRSKLHRLEVKDVDRAMQQMQRGDDCSKHDYIVNSLTEDMLSAIHKVEKRLSNAKDCIIIMAKMQFEIKGYLRQTNTRKKRPETPTVLSKDLRNDILHLEDVDGVGLLYDKLEIHVSKHDDSLQSSIKSLLQRYRYFKPYSIQQVCGSK